MYSSTRPPVVARASFSELQGSPIDLQRAEGFAHTLAEIWQQPDLWIDTARRVLAARPRWSGLIRGSQAIVLTGSGSSHFVGKCLDAALQEQLGVPVPAIEAGELLLLGPAVLPAARPLLVVSFARSGDSPESAGLLTHLLAEEPEVRHLVITCNPQGRLTRTWGPDGNTPDPRVVVLPLDERSCDRSLVMTSSFTSMVVAGLGLGYRDDAGATYLAAVRALADSVRELLNGSLAPFEDFPVERVERLIAVGSGALYGAAQEVALKMLEMTDGRVLTRAETSLGLRHGPMCALRNRSLLFLPLSSDARKRAYQTDLLREVDRKGLGGWKALTAAHVPAELRSPGDLIVELPGLRRLPDEWIALAAVVVGQLLAFLRCRAEGLRPDEPSMDDSITRVVRDFPLHGWAIGAD